MDSKRIYLFYFKTLFVSYVIALLLTACGQGSSASASSAASSNGSGSGTSTGRGTATLTGIPVATGNSVPLVVDAGPVSGSSSVNVGYVSVTVCTPGTSGSTNACQTIDHVTLDTGSYGLRLLNSVLSSNLNLPAASTNGRTIGECVAFVVGSTWGSVRFADIYVGGEVARNVPIQDIGDTPGGALTIPTDCSSTGKVQDTLVTLGSNGILGVGPFVNDCDSCLTQAIPATYYNCNASGCTNSTVTSAQVVRNPVASFRNPTTGVAQDNNGVLVNLPSVPAGGSTGFSGTLIFGIGTQTNNMLNNASIYAVDIYGNFKTTYNGAIQTSYLDSGSNGLFFNDTTIPTCTVNTWAYCPTSNQAISVTNTSAKGSPSGIVTFTIVNADSLFSNNSIVAGNIGGPGTPGTFAWGLPFFFGRPVFTAISGASTPAPGGMGPYWAY